MAAAPWIVSDELWSRIEPLLPKVERRFRYPGRKRLPDRRALQGILFVLHTGIASRRLPLELGFGGGSTCHRRMDEWQRAGVWERTGPSSVDQKRLQAPPPRRGGGIPLAWALTGGNRNDVTQLIPLLDGVPAIRGAVGRPRRRPDSLLADRGYDHDKYRRLVWARGVKPKIARRQTEHGSGLGCHRWLVERT